MGCLALSLLVYCAKIISSAQFICLCLEGTPQIPSTDPPLHVLPEPEFIEELSRFNGTPKAVLENAELMQLLVRILRADFAVLENYVYDPEPSLDFPISAFGGWQDQKVELENLEAWREQTNASFLLQMFPGDHFFIHSARSLLLQSLAQQLHIN